MPYKKTRAGQSDVFETLRCAFLNVVRSESAVALSESSLGLRLKSKPVVRRAVEHDIRVSMAAVTLRGFLGKTRVNKHQFSIVALAPERNRLLGCDSTGFQKNYNKMTTKRNSMDEKHKRGR